MPWLAIVTGLLLGWACAGCDRTEAIRHYRVSKSPTAGAPRAQGQAQGHAQAQDQAHKPVSNASQQRMLAAVVLQTDRAWFFKTVGPDAQVAEQADAFRSLMKSVHFADGKPQWTLPADWRQRGQSGMRFATLEFGPADASMELSVIPLPVPPGERSPYVLSNVNRWRQQMNLAPIAAADLDQQTEKVELDGATAVVVNLQGNPAPAGMGSGMMSASGGGPRAKPATSEGQVPGGESKLRFEAPAGWEAGERDTARGGIAIRHEAAFNVVDGDRRAEITVDVLPPGGGLLGNVNRWRQQVGLAPVDESQLQAGVKRIEVAGQPAEYVELVGEKETILGVVAVRGAEAWYIKFKGDKQLAERQKEPFEAFLASIQTN